MAKLQGHAVIVIDLEKISGYHEKITPHLKCQNLSHNRYHPLTNKTKWENPLLMTSGLVTLIYTNFYTANQRTCNLTPLHGLFH